MPQKLTVAHLHVWDKKNKGDRGIVDAAQELLKKQLPGVKIINFPVHLLKGTNQATIKRINHADLVVIGGGGIFYHWFAPYDVNVIKAIRKPIVIFGVGYIREEGARRLKTNEKRAIALLCQRSKLVGVRDYYTKEFLAKLGLAKSKVKVIGDPVIFLSEKKISKINLKPKVKIGLNINYSGWMGFGQYQSRILNSYEEVAKYFQEKFNAGIYYLQHHPSESIIRKKLKIKNLQVVDFSTRKQKYAYSQLDLIIGMMLHSCVMAFGAGTPEINVTYDIRNRSFAKFIHRPELVISPDKLGAGVLLKKTIDVFGEREEYRRKFKQRKEKIWKKHSAFLNDIKQLVR